MHCKITSPMKLLLSLLMIFGEGLPQVTGVCSETEYACIAKGVKCIPSEKRNDGVDDCGNNSDEVGDPCTDPDDFSCLSGECVSLSLKDDGKNDCPDGSDETKITSTSGSELEETTTGDAASTTGEGVTVTTVYPQLIEMTTSDPGPSSTLEEDMSTITAYAELDTTTGVAPELTEMTTSNPGPSSTVGEDMPTDVANVELDTTSGEMATSPDNGEELSTTSGYTRPSPTTSDPERTSSVRKDASMTTTYSERNEDNNQRLKVSSILVWPYLRAVSDGTSGSRYEGFIKDLLDELTNRLNRTYELVITDTYGKRGANGTWDGMVGDVVSGREDVAAGPLTVTMWREEVVDFTYPFQKFHAVVILSRRQPPMENLESLLAQKNIKYGIVEDSPLAEELDVHPGKLQKKLWQRVSSSSAFVASNQQGVDRVWADADFAFLMESSAALPAVRRTPCQLQVVPAGFFHRQYALAVQNQSPLRDELNRALAHLSHDGTLIKLRNQYFEGTECSSASMVKSQNAFPLCIYTLTLFVLFNSFCLKDMLYPHLAD